VRLLHYTNAQNGRLILRDGELVDGLTKARRNNSQRSVVVPEYDDLIDSVIWLTSEKGARQAWQIFDHEKHGPGLMPDYKHSFRFEIEVPDEDVQTWLGYAEKVGLPDWYIENLGYEGTKPETWYVVTGRTLPVETWLKITFTEGEKRIWRAGESLDGAKQVVEWAYEREQAKLREYVMKHGTGGGNAIWLRQG
jgi:hypothetical protein